MANQIEVLNELATTFNQVLVALTPELRYLGRAYQVEAGARDIGDKIEVANYAEPVTQDQPSGDSVPQDLKETTREMIIDNHLQSTFKLSSKELSLKLGNVALRVVSPAARSMSRRIGEIILGKGAAKIPYIAGVGTGSPASINSVSFDSLADARLLLSQNDCPVEGRIGIITPQVNHDFITDSSFREVSKSGTSTAFREGFIDRAAGIDWFEGNNVQTSANRGRRTADGTAYSPYAAVTSGIETNGVQAINSDVISVDGIGASRPTEGARFKIASDDQIYVIDELPVDDTKAAGMYKISPKLKKEAANDAALDFNPLANHYMNVVGQPDMIQRVFVDLIELPGMFSQVIEDEDTGVITRLSMDGQILSGNVIIKVECLFGVDVFLPELGVVIASPAT